MRRYFISYRFSGGFGRCYVDRTGPLQWADIIKLEKWLAEDNKLTPDQMPLLIMSWQEFEQPQAADSET